jgi:hypothetical protein
MRDDRTVPSATTGVAENISGPRRIELPITDLECPSCAKTIEQALEGLKGVLEAK